MSAYAQNPQRSAEPAYASLTAGLLARKGEALPAVDADAHIGVDMHMAAPSARIVQAIHQGSGRRETHRSQQQHMRVNQPQPLQDGVMPEALTSKVADKAPDMWTTSSPPMTRESKKEPEAVKSTEPKKQRKANITFRMPASDFIRLRFGSRELGMSCQSIILEALDCYLDANDVVPVSDEDCKIEMARLRSHGKATGKGRSK